MLNYDSISSLFSTIENDEGYLSPDAYTFDRFNQYHYYLVEEKLTRFVYQSMLLDDTFFLQSYSHAKEQTDTYRQSFGMEIKMLNITAKQKELPPIYEGPIPEKAPFQGELYDDVLEFVKRVINSREENLKHARKPLHAPANFYFDAIKALIDAKSGNRQYLIQIKSLLMLAEQYHDAVFKEQFCIKYLGQADEVQRERRSERYNNLVLGIQSLDLFADSSGTAPIYSGYFDPYDLVYHPDETVFNLLDTILTIP